MAKTGLRNIVLACFLFVVIGTTPSYGKGHEPLWEKATLADVAYDVKADGVSTANGQVVGGGETRYPVLTVKFESLLVTGRGYMVKTGKLDARNEAAEFVVGDEIQASMDRDKLFVKRPNGKTWELRIIRRERVK